VTKIPIGADFRARQREVNAAKAAALGGDRRGNNSGLATRLIGEWANQTIGQASRALKNGKQIDA